MKQNGLLFIAIGIAIGYYFASKTNPQLKSGSIPTKDKPITIGSYDVV